MKNCAYPDLIEEYLREFRYLVHGRDKVIRNYTHTVEHKERERKILEEEGLPMFTVSPEMFRERTQVREKSERYRGVYTTLGLRIVAHEDGTLEFTWKAGEGVSEVCVSPRCKAAATISSSSILAK